MATQATHPRPHTVPYSASEATAREGHASLPRGWRHSLVVAWVLDQPREQRETVLAGLFGFVAAVWAPIGILAFLANVFTIFLVASGLVLVAVVAPRPTAVAHLTAAVRQHVTPRIQTAWQELGRASAHVRRELPGVLAALRAEAAPVLCGARDAVAAATSTTVARARRATSHALDRLGELGPRPAQSSPRSTR